MMRWHQLNVQLSRRDSIIYSATCEKLKNQQVAIKMYNKAKLSPSKLRAIKREAAMMIYMTRKRYSHLLGIFS